METLNLDDILANTSDLSQEKKVGYVAIIWRPNVGKSTFINTLIGEKISITTHIPQTTRRRVLAIFNDDDSQIVFFDTPWIHKSEKKFNEKINNVALSTFKDAEVILYFIDTSRQSGEEENYIEQILENVNKPILKVYTKSDLPMKIPVEKQKNCFQISSVLQEWFSPLIDKIKTYLHMAPLLFPTDFYTKQDIYFRISEIIREKVFLNTKEELPHSIFVGVEEIEDTQSLLKIVAYIYAETDSQKYILIWKAGWLIEKIWKESRIELEWIFWKKVFLALRVKVKENWRKDDGLLKKLLY